MAAKVFNPPADIKLPSFSSKTYREDEEKYVKQIKDFVTKRKAGKNIGEIVRFQVADGYAEYMVASMKPLELVHLPTGDAWEYQYINRLTVKDIQQRLDFETSLTKFRK